jgi:hypothetical protein
MGNGQTGSTSDAGATAPELGDQVGELASQVQEQAGRLTDQARGQIATGLTAQKDRAAGGLETAAGLLRGAGEQLRALDQPTVAQLVDGTADRAQQFSEQLRTQDLGQLVEATERFARRQPALFAGSALALGFLATRFLRSSQPQQATTEGHSAARGSAPYGGDIYLPDYAGMPTGSYLGTDDVPGTGPVSGLGGVMAEAGPSSPPMTPTDYPRGSEEL